jgi:regulatory protein
MQITAIRRQKKNADRLNLYLEGEFAFALSVETALKAGLRRGQVIDETRRLELETEDAFWRARESALVLLSHRARSERELRDRLVGRGYTAEVADRTVGNLRERGLLDDVAFAQAFARDRLRSRPSGRRRIMAELRRKGVSPQDAERALEQISSGSEEAEIDLARRAASKFPRKKIEDRAATKRRLYAYLARRGFGSSVISAIAREYLSADK